MGVAASWICGSVHLTMALIPPSFFNAVVAIGEESIDKTGKPLRSWIATGFFYGRKFEGGYHIFLVTNRHVFERFAKKTVGYFRLNPAGEIASPDFPFRTINDDGSQAWHLHPRQEVDIAVTPVSLDLIKQGITVSFFESDKHAVRRDEMKAGGITEGDFVFVMGFPMGLVGERVHSVIVRSGSIARIRDLLKGASDDFLIDAFVFPGNSGGPVLLKPDALAITGTKPQNRSLLLGIVCSYIPYEDVAYSLQTMQPRIVFQDNSGLASVHPVDLIEETIDVAYSYFATRKAGLPTDVTEAQSEPSPKGVE